MVRIPGDVAIKMPPAYSDLFINNTGEARDSVV